MRKLNEGRERRITEEIKIKHDLCAHFLMGFGSKWDIYTSSKVWEKSLIFNK